jgi:hypothetical protein
MPLSHNCFLTVSLGLAMVSCSRSKTTSRDELRSDLQAAVSLASETELFTDQLEEGRATRAFAEVHLTYLEKDVARSAQELHQANPNDSMVGPLEAGRTQLDSLARVLAILKEKSGDDESLVAGKKQAVRIQSILQHAKDSL